MPDGTAPPAVANPITDYVPSARPGGRAPHVWLERDGERLSTIDLVGNGFVLLTSHGGQSVARRRHSASASGPSASATASLADPEGQWTTAYGLDETGAVLVRPDGYVGWRSPAMTADPAASLGEAMTSIMGRA